MRTVVWFPLGAEGAAELHTGVEVVSAGTDREVSPMWSLVFYRGA